MNTSVFNIGDQCKLCTDNVTIYTVYNTRIIFNYQEIKIKWYMDGGEVISDFWHYAKDFIKIGKIGEDGMTVKKCVNCECKANNIDYVELTKKALFDILTEASSDEWWADTPQKIFDSTDESSDIKALSNLLNDFGYDVEIKTLGFEVVLTKK